LSGVNKTTTLVAVLTKLHQEVWEGSRGGHTIFQNNVYKKPTMPILPAT
jgi:hypothetical protein